MEIIDTLTALSAELHDMSRLDGVWEWIVQASYKSASGYHTL